MSCFSRWARSLPTSDLGIGGAAARRQPGRPCRHTACRGRSRACCGCRRSRAWRSGRSLHAPVGPAWRLGVLRALEHPIVEAVADDALPQPVAENMGKIVPGELVDVAWILGCAVLDDGLDAAGDEERRRHTRRCQGCEQRRDALIADRDDHEIDVLLLEVGDHHWRWRPDRACCRRGTTDGQRQG